MTQSAGTNRQVPDNAIFDHFGKQVYLGNQWNYVLASTSSGTGEVAKLLLVNPAVTASAFPASYISLFCNLRRLANPTASANTVVRVYLNPTYSAAGSAAMATNSRPAQPNGKVGALTTGPTVSVNGTLIEVLTAGNFEMAESNSLFILDPGNSMLITVASADAAVNDVQFGWFEI